MAGSIYYGRRMSAAVSLHVLGPARISIDGSPAPAELLWRKHLALLVYLARSPRRARTREHLIGLLWSERDEKSARHSLSEALRVFRRVLGDERVHADVDQVSLADGAVSLAWAERLTAELHDRLGMEPAPETHRLVARVREARVARRVVASPSGARPRAPLIGRGAELARLIAAWERARGGVTGVVLIEGEPGEGKTRLLEELLDRARLEDASVASCRAVPSDAGVPWTGLGGLLSGGLGTA